MPTDRINGEILFDIDVNNVEKALQGTGWTSGWAVTAVSGQLKVSVALGTGLAAGVIKSTTGATEITLDTADPTSPRKDLIVYDVSASALAKVTGTPESISPSGETNARKMTAPKPPDPADSADIILAVVYVPAGCTDADNCTIIDKRVMAVLPAPTYLHQAISLRAFTDSAGTWTMGAGGTGYQYTHAYLSHNPANDQDYVSYTLWLPAGNYRGHIGVYLQVTFGVLKIYVDDVLKQTYNCYSSSWSIGVVDFDFVIDTTGEHIIKFKVDGGTSGYDMALYEGAAVGRY